MAFTTFYVQSGGSNANSGTTTISPVWSNTASVVWTGTTTSTLVTSDSGASAVVAGHYINVGGTWVSKVVSNTFSSPNYTITLSGTTGWGTEPTSQTYSSNSTVIDGGAWLDLTQGILTGTSTVPSSTMVCVAQSMSLTLGGALQLGLKGATTTPVWYRGYNTSVGDLDNGSTTLSYPTINQSTYTVTFGNAGEFLMVSGFIFTGSAATLVTQSGFTILEFRHCQFTTTNTSSSATAFVMPSSIVVRFRQCIFSTPSTANQIISNAASGTQILDGCYLVGAGGSTQVGIVATTGRFYLNKTTIANCGAQGIVLTTGFLYAVNSTFTGCGSDAIKWTGTPGVSGIINCAFFKSGGYDINNASGANVTNVQMENNLSYSPTGTHLNGFGDWYEFGGTSPSAGAAAFVDGSDTRTSSTDFHLLASSLGCGAGIPGQWENQTSGLTATPDIGAWQRQVLGPGANSPFSG